MINISLYIAIVVSSLKIAFGEDEIALLNVNSEIFLICKRIQILFYGFFVSDKEVILATSYIDFLFS